jgi:signal transduction histidine kinase
MAFPPHKEYLDIGVSVVAPHQQIGALVLRYSLDTHYGSVRSMKRYIFGYLGINFIILVVLGFFRMREQLFRPVERMIRMTDSYRDENGVPFLSIQGGDELSQLSASMQQMLTRIKSDRETMQRQVASLEEANLQLIATREEMVRSEKLSSVGRLAAGLAHEIGNPIGIVQGYLGLIQQQGLNEKEKQDFCWRAEQELQRISQLVRRLLDLSRSGSGEEQEVDAHLVLKEVVSLLRPQPLMDGIDIRVSLSAAESLVRINPDQLLQVFLNCLINAADAMPVSESASRGIIEISTDVVDDESCRNVRVVISDTGTGLDHEVLSNAFDPFFTTKEPGKGTGLGLSVSYALIKGMGGRISLANREGGGAAVSIILPVVKG